MRLTHGYPLAVVLASATLAACERSPTPEAGHAGAAEPPPAESAASVETEAEAVRRVVASVAHDIDAKRWDQLRSLYANEVATDYTSLFGGEPQVQTGDALIGGWTTVLAKVATQHLLGPITVDVSGKRATASCHVRAMHYAERAPGGEHWEVLGHYVFDLEREGRSWKIRKMTLLTQLQTGNTKLLTEAAAR